jgi:hypothetical protein
LNKNRQVLYVFVQLDIQETHVKYLEDQVAAVAAVAVQYQMLVHMFNVKMVC